MKTSRMQTLVLTILLVAGSCLAQEKITPEEFRLRRRNLMARLPDGVLLLHARNLLDNDDALFVHGFQQNPSFFYFTGLSNAVNAILAIDGAAQESWLFVPSRLPGLEKLLPQALIPPGRETETKLLLEHVVPWEEFTNFIDRKQQQSRLILYVDDGYWVPPPPSNPSGIAPITDTPLLWRNALSSRWPTAEIRSAREAIWALRVIKSPAEIETIRRVAEVSTEALLAGLRALRPNKSQREVEAEVVCSCIRAGGEGPSFWPWIMSGPNAVIPKPFESLVDYRHLNRLMQAGELVRVDIGCDVDFYKGDVGRTAPVSGRFTPEQREAWNLLIKVYRAGLAVMRDGTRHEDVMSACRREAERLQPGLKTSLGKAAAKILLDPDNRDIWHLHTSGLEPGEKFPGVLKAGMVIEFEPMFAVAGQAFYLEDMILITAASYEILTKGLPYTADEIERAIAETRER